MGKTLFGPSGMTDVKIVTPPFGHYVNFASTVGTVPGGLVKWGKMTEKLRNQHDYIVTDTCLLVLCHPTCLSFTFALHTRFGSGMSPFQTDFQQL